VTADTTQLWALIARRADASPDGLLTVDEHDRVLTFGTYRDQPR
jgi:hypothetical protein